MEALKLIENVNFNSFENAIKIAISKLKTKNYGTVANVIGTDKGTKIKIFVTDVAAAGAKGLIEVAEFKASSVDKTQLDASTLNEAFYQEVGQVTMFVVQTVKQLDSSLIPNVAMPYTTFE